MKRMPEARSLHRLLATVLVLTVAAPVLMPASMEAKTRRSDLAERYQQFLDDVEIIMRPRERKQFLKLQKDYQRDAFIRRFWRSRDPDPDTPDNRFKGQYMARLAEARERYEYPADERRSVFVLNGEPASIEETDCGLLLWPIQFWRYAYSEHSRGDLTLIFYQRGTAGPFKLWQPSEGYGVLVQVITDKTFEALMRDNCAETFDYVEELILNFRIYKENGRLDIIAATRAPQLDAEWMANFRAFSTDVDPDAPALEASVIVDYPGLHRQRVIARSLMEVPAEAAQVVDLAGRRSFNFSLIGELLVDEELFDSFKYVFDVPETEAAGEVIPLIFERWLRPGDYTMILKLEDLHGGRAARLEQVLEVPQLAAVGEGVALAALTELAEAPRTLEPTIHLVAEGKDLQRGYARFTASVDGDGIAKVRFFLEDRPVLTKTRPPFSVELDLGSLPDTMAVRAVALGAAGEELATDEVLLNPGEYSFGISLIEPQWGSRHSGTVRARAEVQTPEDSVLERVEFFRDDVRVATLFQPPFSTPVPLVGDGLAVIRVAAFLEDGNSTEDIAILNGADYLEKIDVRMVEVFASVLDAGGRPLTELDRAAFRVFENGSEQEILRFEQLDDLPIYAGLLIDTSASMVERIEAVRDAAVRFFEQAIRPRDRAAVVTFASKPRLAAGFTNDMDALGGALAGIRAGEGTALYDSVLFALYNFRGLKGQRALLILSDGEDRRSKATFDEAREFALSSGVTLYTIGVEKGMSRRGKAELARLAEETGGRAFLIDSVSELDAIYSTIQKDLRSKYFLAYQPGPADDRDFRSVEVQVSEPGAEVRALRGYVPR